MISNFKQIHDAISSDRLYKQVKEISCFHRIQASTTYRDAANYVTKLAQSYGLNTQLLEYPATGDNWYMENKMFKEWSIEEATLDLVDPDTRLCDYSSCPISVIQKSYPVDLRDNPVELIHLDKGSNPDNYKDIDVKGKMAFVRTWHDEYTWFYDQGGLGVVTDFVRTDSTRSRHDQYKIRTYTSYWHKHSEDEPHKFGFVITPEMGDKLEQLFKTKKELNEPVLVKPYVKSSLYEGNIEVISIKIEGKDDKTVLLTAHLCHPNPSCNDNTSGVSATLEAMHVIQKLINEGKIDRPQHSIECVLMPEFTGTYAYMSDHLSNKYIGAINLDMVGAKQDRTNGPITLTMLPLSTPSIINEISSLAMDMAAQESVSHEGNAIPLTSYIHESFSGGSDHVFYSDPTINIPCCMLGQWPDRFYHTSGDTLDVIDPEVLKFSCTTATMFALLLANISINDLPSIINEMSQNLTDQINGIYQQYLNGIIDQTVLSYKFNALDSFYRTSIKNISSLVPDVDSSWIDKTTRFISNTITSFRDYHEIPTINHPVNDTRVFTRQFVGPIYSLDDYCFKGYKQQLDDFFSNTNFADARAVRQLAMVVPMFIDGIRTVDQICEIFTAQTGTIQDQTIIALIDCLEAIDLIRKC